MDFCIQKWDKPDPPGEHELRDICLQEGLRPYSWSNSPGDTYPAHSHGYHKVIYVVSGSITWILPEKGRVVETTAGDRIDLPKGVLHAARVGDLGVKCLESHLD
jgi:quercetin dioxygenase-like cupin family protein